MSDEEKEAIEILKLYFGDNPTLNITKYVNIVLNLIEKQSKEIEANKGYHLGFVDGGIAKRYEMENKIKAKIEEEDKLFFKTKDVRHANRYKAYKELLEKE